VPRRWDREPMASLYRNSMAGVDTWVPYGGRSEPSPKRGAGGGLRNISTGEAGGGSGEISCSKEMECV
jgi:hypothetical protein